MRQAMKIYLIRHGETQWNLEERVQGKTDVPLNESGLRQAEYLREAVKDIPFDTIYASPLVRAYSTAEVVAESHGLPITVLPDLAEVGFGKWEGKTIPEIISRDPGKFERWKEAPTVELPEEGESHESIHERVERVVRRITEGKPGPYGACAVISHGGIQVYLVEYLLRKEKEKRKIRMKNASITLVEYNPESGEGKLVFMNDTSHLPEELIRETGKTDRQPSGSRADD